MGFGRGSAGNGGPSRSEQERRKDEARRAALASYRRAADRQRRGGPRPTWREAWSQRFNADGDRYCGRCDKVLFKDEIRALWIIGMKPDDPGRPKNEKRAYPCPVAPWFKQRHLTSQERPRLRA